MLREEIAAGRLPGAAFARHLPQETATRDVSVADLLQAGGFRVAATVALRPDAQANDKTGDATCAAGCANRPLDQAETTIAAWGRFVLAGWNDTKGFCTGGAVQGYGYSSDGGATWVDAGEVPALAGSGRYRGDPVHGVNVQTGDFYICGLYQGGALGSGLALLRGHFAGAAFVVDDNRQIAVGEADFLDKEWMTVDPLTGNVYVTYTRFAAGDNRIEFIRSTDNGVTWDPPIVMNLPAANGLVQGSRPAVGPDGEVYVVWYEFGFPQSHMRLRRSDDFGVTFGPERTVTDFFENYYSGAPGFRRPFGIALPSIAVDHSNGPHRGRVYVVWDESVNHTDAPFSSATAQSEIESNDFFASATSFTVGDVLRGAMVTSADVDFFSFTALRGQTFVLRGDSASTSANLNVRIVCPSDTSNMDHYRLVAFTQAGLPGLVWTAPADGRYFLRLSVASGAPLSYVMSTTFDTPSAGERARDHRDRFASHSDDGNAWSTPVMLNDDDPWFDGEFPEVTVDGTGAVHVFWHDFRDDPGCGAESFEYMVSSGDGGVSWGPNRRVSDQPSFWSFNACGSANHGDYQGITSDGATVFPCWADSRLGDPDVFAEGPTFAHGATCPPEELAPAGSASMVTFRLENRSTVDGAFGWRVEDDRGWVASAVPSPAGTVSLSPMGTQEVVVTLTVPVSCPVGPNRVRLVTGDLHIPGRLDTCETEVFCVSATSVAEPATSLWLAPTRPNPSAGGVAIDFSLTREGPVRLDIFGPNGARVRNLIQGMRAAGPHGARWDGRDERGRRAAPGVYYVRLEAEELSLRQPFVLVR